MMYFPLYTDSIIPDYRSILSVIPFNNSFYVTPREIRGIVVTKFKKNVDSPHHSARYSAQPLPAPHQMTHPWSARNSSEGGARLNRRNGAFTNIDHRITEGEVIFLQSSGLIVPAGPIDTDGGVIGRQGKIPITVYVMLALTWGHDMLSLSREEFKGLKRNDDNISLINRIVRSDIRSFIEHVFQSPFPSFLPSAIRRPPVRPGIFACSFSQHQRDHPKAGFQDAGDSRTG